MAVIELDFDPFLRAGDLVVRWQALALVAVIGVALLVWVRSLRTALGPNLPFEDAAFVLLAAIPGAVVGGRLVHGLDFLDAYTAQPAAIVDLSRGSLSLVGAVVGGALTSAYVCRLLGGRVGVWADASAVALLLAIGLGKLVMLLGGAGQGAAFGGQLAVAFGGSGPWSSPGAATPAHPAQVYEGLWTLAGVPLAWWLTRLVRGGPREGHGLVLLAAVAWWLLGRAVIALAWRDAAVLGPLGMEGLLTCAAFLCVVALLVAELRHIGRTPQRNLSAP